MKFWETIKALCDCCRLPLLLHGTGQVHMTEGPIVAQLLLFMLPLLVSQILQQFYGIADTAMVGHYLGAAALAALGTTNLLLNVIVNFYIGLSTGISVILSQLFGSCSYKELNTSIQTILSTCLLVGLALTFVGWGAVEVILESLSTPEDIKPIAAAYLQVSFLGLTAQLFYNVCNSMLQALGNTTSAFHYLLLASLVNLVLDYVFLQIIPLGVTGAALATVLAQYLAAILVLRKLFCLEGDWHYSFAWPLIDFNYLRELLVKGIPAGMQAIFMSISSLLIQTYINSFGYGAMAGMTVFARVEGFLYTPLFTFGLALTSFIGQNVGAGRMDRVKEGMKLSMKLAVGGALLVGFINMLLAPFIMQAFTQDKLVLQNGLQAVYYVFPCYWGYAICQVYIGGLRGLGNTFYPMLTSLIAYSLFRVGWCQAWDRFLHDMIIVYTAYDVSFFIMAALLYWGYRHYLKRTLMSLGHGVSHHVPG